LTKHGPLQLDEATRLFTKVVVPVMVHAHATTDDIRHGAVFEWRGSHNMTQLFVVGGNASSKAVARYQENARAKNDALEDHPNYCTSWQVHEGDTSYQPYPGGIRTPRDDRMAISGFDWRYDTIGCLWIAMNVGRMRVEEAAAIADVCGIRDLFYQMIERLDTTYKKLCETQTA
jgi:hypothetical protein